jgi:hypothetical protein
MPAEGHKTRRALLRLFGAAPALAILPAGSALALASTASPAHPDAALFAMQSAIEVADRELQAAFDACNPAEDAYFDKQPDRPDEPTGPVFSAEEQLALDEFAAKVRARRKRGRPPEWVAYEHAVEAYEQEKERLQAECGVTAAHEMRDAAQETVSQLLGDVIDTPAKTLAGLIFKARYAASHYEDDYDEDVMISIVDDLLAMADEEEGGADV